MLRYIMSNKKVRILNKYNHNNQIGNKKRSLFQVTLDFNCIKNYFLTILVM